MPALAADDSIKFDIPRKRADAALIMFAEQADLTLIFPYEEVKTKHTNQVIGRYSIEKAITRLLRNTGLRAHVSDDHQLTIVSKPSFGELNKMLKKSKISTATIAAMTSMISVNAAAQDIEQNPVLEEVVVTGFRGSLNRALDFKRESGASVDSIVAEDIADFPDLNLADSMGRIPGVNIDRSNGEGNQISVRGLSADFTRVQINGMETMSAGDDNTSRSFDFNMFASELFNRIDVQKTQTANVDEGSLGATVRLYTGRPFDYDDFVFVAGYQQGYNDQSESWDPRATALVSFHNADSTFGASFSVAYNKRNIIDQGYNSDSWEANSNMGLNHWANWGGEGNLQDYDTAVHPRFPRYPDYDTDQERLGITGSVQWRPADSTLVTTDVLYSKMDASTYFPGITPISLSRTNATGRAETTVSNPVIENGVMIEADLDGVDVRSENFFKEYTNEFQQITIDVEHEFNDRLRLNALLGTSESSNERSRETTVIMEAFNQQMHYAYDGVADGTPLISYGFDLTDPSNYYLSELRDRPNYIDNDYDTLKVDVDYDINDIFSVEAGLSYKDFAYSRTQYRRDRALMSLDTDGVIDENDMAAQLDGCDISFSDLQPTAESGYLSEFGEHLNLPAGMDQTRHFVGSIDAVERDIGFYNNPACFPLTLNTGSQQKVEETDSGGYVQLNWYTDIAGMGFRGNAGARYTKTEQAASGWQSAGEPVWVTVEREYDDVLPSINLALEVLDDVLVRASWSEVMSRPTLGDLTPGGNVDGFNRTVSFGNPSLDPFLADAYDLSVEWYFANEALLSLAYFDKQIDSFIVGDTSTRPWTSLGLPDSLLEKQPASPADDFDVTSRVNGRGGELNGWELQYQQAFTFLPGFLADTGIKANYTIIDSEVSFGTDVNGQPILGTLNGTSENSWNATLWYENVSGFAARMSWSYRDEYQTTPDSRSGLPGMDYVAAQTYVDFAASYEWSEHLKFSLEANNLTDEPKRALQSDLGLVGDTSYYGTQYHLGVQYTF